MNQQHSDDDEPTRIGIELNRKTNEAWHEVVSRYAAIRNKAFAATEEYHKLVAKGAAPPFAALRALMEFGCTDVIISDQHLTAENIANFN